MAASPKDCTTPLILKSPVKLMFAHSKSAREYPVPDVLTVVVGSVIKPLKSLYSPVSLESLNKPVYFVTPSLYFE